MSRVAQAVSKNAKKPASTGAKWDLDKATKRSAPVNDTKTLADIKAIEGSNLSPDLKAQAIAAAKAACGSPFTMTKAVAQEEGVRDLVEISGDHMPKMLSPTLVRAVAENSAFVLKTLTEFGL